MNLTHLAAVCIAIVAGMAIAETPKAGPPPAPASGARNLRTLDLYLSHNLVRAGQVRYTHSADAIAALKRNEITTVRILVCPLTHRENVDKLVDALLAADIGVSEAKVVARRESLCADNARVETRAGT